MSDCSLVRVSADDRCGPVDGAVEMGSSYDRHREEDPRGTSTRNTKVDDRGEKVEARSGAGYHTRATSGFYLLTSIFYLPLLFSLSSTGGTEPVARNLGGAVPTALLDP